jgi:hypothetical protein
MITRTLTQTIIKHLKSGFVTITYGARRVGKTVLLKQLVSYFKDIPLLFLNGDTQETRDLLSTTSEVKLSQLVEKYPVVFIDEAQRISNISLVLKIIIDKYPEKKIIVTGSSLLELAKGAHENLTGRNIIYNLYPLSTKEVSSDLADHKIPYLLEDQLIFGGYPYLTNLSDPREKQAYLNSIVNDYLFKDVLALERIENPDILKKTAMLLAFQIGNLVSFNELSNTLGIDIKTVSRYVHVLEKGFVVFGVGSYSTNLRSEIAKRKKYYFYDLGIRNALTNQFFSMSSRTDLGNLWENFLFIERKKKQEYAKNIIQSYFWRNYQGAEVDMIEVSSEKTQAFEFKWKTERYKTPKNFQENYKITASLINKDNYLEFII